ncbi:hypothetical protein AJ88_26725 [Mesorhizobium amorphae CCBAU 01583]|nr:hypothetical protein AJ88_26725 [Mesorhizobium amorphae CCBAU 01583]
MKGCFGRLLAQECVVSAVDSRKKPGRTAGPLVCRVGFGVIGHADNDRQDIECRHRKDRREDQRRRSCHAKRFGDRPIDGADADQRLHREKQGGRNGTREGFEGFDTLHLEVPEMNTPRGRCTATAAARVTTRKGYEWGRKARSATASYTEAGARGWLALLLGAGTDADTSTAQAEES